MRAVSTVLDVSLCLLFVTASALTLVGTPLAEKPNPETAPDTADEAVEVLTTTTASVSYGVGDRNRTAHGTLAGLLASGALTDPSSASVVEFRSAVTERVARAFRFTEVEVQVTAEAVVPNSTRDDLLVAGTSPPPTADVHAATVAVRDVRLTVRTWSR